MKSGAAYRAERIGVACATLFRRRGTLWTARQSDALCRQVLADLERMFGERRPALRANSSEYQIDMGYFGGVGDLDVMNVGLSPDGLAKSRKRSPALAFFRGSDV